MTHLESDLPLEVSVVTTDDEVFDLPEGSLLYKPHMNGWTLFRADVGGTLTVIDAFDRDARGRRYSYNAIGSRPSSPGYVLWRPPALGYYTPPASRS